MPFTPDDAVHFKGSDRLCQGSDFQRTITIKVAGVAQDLSAYNATVPTGVFKDQPGGTSTGSPQPTYSWVNAGAGQIGILVPRAQMASLTKDSTVGLKGTHRMKITANAGSQLVDRMIQGEWEVDLE